jgi:hypothetical protein
MNAFAIPQEERIGLLNGHRFSYRSPIPVFRNASELRNHTPALVPWILNVDPLE